jgi:hypothetical protein
VNSIRPMAWGLHYFYTSLAVLRHSRSEDLSVTVLSRQFVLASGLIAAAILFGSSRARAGYVSVPGVAEHDAGGSLALSPVSPLSDLDASARMSGSSTASQSRPDTDCSDAPSHPVPPSRKLPYSPNNFAHGTGAGSSSGSNSGNGPTTSLVSDLPRPQVPPLELASLLPPQAGDAQPFSMSSFLFRPPRIS